MAFQETIFGQDATQDFGNYLPDRPLFVVSQGVLAGAVHSSLGCHLADQPSRIFAVDPVVSRHAVAIFLVLDGLCVQFDFLRIDPGWQVICAQFVSFAQEDDVGYDLRTGVGLEGRVG